MIKKIGIGFAALALALIGVSCAGSTAVPQTTVPQQSVSDPSPASPPPPAETAIQATTEKPSGPIRATLIEAQVSGDKVSIPISDIEGDWNTQFVFNSQSGKMNFMAYLLKNKIYVRADVCPPCRSIGYSLDNNTLVCDRCATTFRADTGDGIAGACVDYPKALVPYQISNGNIVMQRADLVAAYESTLNPGWP
jgi:nitrite reductase/ring-hydroxylating ferredoxin subunit